MKASAAAYYYLLNSYGGATGGGNLNLVAIHTNGTEETVYSWHYPEDASPSSKFNYYDGDRYHLAAPATIQGLKFEFDPVPPYGSVRFFSTGGDLTFELIGLEDQSTIVNTTGTCLGLTIGTMTWDGTGEGGSIIQGFHMPKNGNVVVEARVSAICPDVKEDYFGPWGQCFPGSLFQLMVDGQKEDEATFYFTSATTPGQAQLLQATVHLDAGTHTVEVRVLRDGPVNASTATQYVDDVRVYLDAATGYDNPAAIEQGDGLYAIARRDANHGGSMSIFGVETASVEVAAEAVLTPCGLLQEGAQIEDLNVPGTSAGSKGAVPIAIALSALTDPSLGLLSGSPLGGGLATATLQAGKQVLDPMTLNYSPVTPEQAVVVDFFALGPSPPPSDNQTTRTWVDALYTHRGDPMWNPSTFQPSPVLEVGQSTLTIATGDVSGVFEQLKRDSVGRSEAVGRVGIFPVVDDFIAMNVVGFARLMITSVNKVPSGGGAYVYTLGIASVPSACVQSGTAASVEGNVADSALKDNANSAAKPVAQPYGVACVPVLGR
jgi:hypothetical protein